MAETSMRAATQIGTLEYQLFAEWYKNTYGQNPPKNDTAIVSNPQYQFWKNVIRSTTWTPKQETQATIDRLTKGGSILAIPPALIPPTATTTSQTGTKVVSINGYDFLEIDGQVVPDPIGKTGTKDYQQGQLDLATRQWNTQQAQTGTNWLQTQETNKRLAELNNYNYANQQLLNTNMNRESDIRNEERQKMATQYDEWKTRLMGELETSPRSWIQYKELQAKPNPYSVTPMNQGEEIQNTEQQLKQVQKQQDTMLKDLKQEADNAAKAWGAAASRVTDDYTIMDSSALLEAKSRYDTAITNLNAVQDSLSGKLAGQTAQWEADKSVPGTDAYWATPRPTGEGGNMSVGSGDVAAPKGIATPAWMGEYLSNPTPYLTKQELAPISGQALTRTSPTNLQQLYGYMDWTGQNTSDWLQTSQQQLTNNPYVSGRWTPKRTMR